MKIIFVDIDGTIFDNATNLVPPSTIYALKAIRKRGHKLFVCSSRAKDEMCVSLKGLEDLFDGYVCAAGSIVYIDDKIYHAQVIDQQSVNQLVEIFDKKDMTYRWLDSNGCGYINRIDASVMEIFYGYYQYVPPVLQYDGRPLVHLLFYVTGDEMMESINYNHQEISIVHIKNTKEAVAKGVNKAFGMQVVCDHYGLKASDTVAFGDGYNDLEMIEFAGIGVAMGNANSGLKSIANHITDDVSDDGFYKACINIELISED